MKSAASTAWATAILAAAKASPPRTSPATYPSAPPSDGAEGRVEFLADLMARGEYMSRLTLTSLAQLWGAHGVSFTMLERDATAASRRVRAAQGSRRDMVIDTLSKLDACYRDAKAEGRTRDAIAALRAKAQITGPLVPMISRPRTPAPSGLPPELARLTPAPSAEEVAHFATVEGPAACVVEGCRVHQKAPATPAAPEGAGLH